MWDHNNHEQAINLAVVQNGAALHKLLGKGETPFSRVYGHEPRYWLSSGGLRSGYNPT